MYAALASLSLQVANRLHACRAADAATSCFMSVWTFLQISLLYEVVVVHWSNREALLYRRVLLSYSTLNHEGRDRGRGRGHGNQ